MKDQYKGDILAVDDVPANLRLLSKLLLQQNYRVRAVTSGQRALDMARLYLPDLILLDVMMPGINGYEVCGRLKSDKRTAGIPVIFLSALNETLDKVRAFSLGAVDFITKPYQAEEVLARIDTHLSLRALQRQLEEAYASLDKRNRELQARNNELREALATIKTLSGLIPICAWCGKRIQDEDGQWHAVDHFIEEHSEAEFTHGICPDCLTKFHKEP